MPVLDHVAADADAMRDWRRQLHAQPELGFECQGTAAFVADKLREFGVDEIHTGIAKTGVIGIIHGQGADASGAPVIGLRADMDALPMTEATGLPHASAVPGRMHACGHDGHTAMLLGAAKYLSATRRFAGRVAVIFQPAEEDGGGGQVMVQAGVMDRFGIGRVFALHNVPGYPAGRFMTTPGPIMAAADTFDVHITGTGGHGAYPQDCVDPIPAALAIGQAFSTIAARDVPPEHAVVLSLTQIHAGTVSNVIPSTAYLNGTVRSFAPEVPSIIRRRMTEIGADLAAAHNLSVAVDYAVGYPATINDPAQAAFAADAAAQIVGADHVDPAFEYQMGAEDFAYMLQARPGAYLFLGAGDGAGLHNPHYDFNDEIAPIGASFFARLVEMAQPTNA